MKRDNNKANPMTLKQAQNDPDALESFISEREPLDAPMGAVKRYIDASAIPLGSSKANPSDDFLDGPDDCT